MSVEVRTVAEDEAEIRLDRWFKRHFPEVTHGRLEKLLRTGQVRVDGGRAKANVRLSPGQQVRVPPLPAVEPVERTAEPMVIDRDGEDLQKRVLFRDEWVIALNKPSGLATQGGSGQTKHVDGMLDALRFGSNDRPRLVHRLDKDTSGVLLLARTPGIAAKLAEAFRHRTARKLYWALTVGVPEPEAGRIDKPLAKIAAAGGERMMEDEEDGQYAVTLYHTLETAGRRAAWVALMPQTGRTHQLRVHMAMLGKPIVGDRKYGGEAAKLAGGEVSSKLHLHARRIILPHPKGGTIDVTAPLPDHMRATWKLLDFDTEDSRFPFKERRERY